MKEAGWDNASAEAVIETETEFTGYDTLAGEGKVLALIKDGQAVDSISEGDEAAVILDRTPFYATSGGQNADKGIMTGDGVSLIVNDVTKSAGVFSHVVTVETGSVKTGDTLSCSVETIRRNRTACNHTATHMLHAALRKVLGDHVKQAGSSVTAESLRFDFNHFQAVTAEEINEIERIVNEKIAEFIDVNTKVMPIAEAQEEGAMALFDEKYGDFVRIVSVGDYSVEFCGGTHISNSGQIGAFKIISESGVASGVRRIEAVTGQGILARYNDDEALINSTAGVLKSNRDNLTDKSASRMDEVKKLKKEIEELKKAEMSKGLDSLVDTAEVINGIKLVTKQFEDYSINDLRSLSDDIKASNKGVAMVFATVNGPKVTFLVSLTDDLVESGLHAGKMIKEVAAAAGGGGGGKADMAQAGAKDASKIPDAFAKAAELIK